ncbi:iron-sulfur cluster assembly scaffold protein [candidate division WOR-3 bacterium]|nr:iron-sulfur cluster assembly scaffold protein [candidate division WOR-3 bacterium]
MDTFERFAKNLQRHIDEETGKVYSEKVIAHWKNPQNWGIMNRADGYGRFTGPCGDTMEISIKVRHGVISKCTFDTDGCGTTIACGSIITEIATGKNIAEAKKIDQAQMLATCGKLPEENEHCALLAATALHCAIDDYESKRR